MTHAALFMPNGFTEVDPPEFASPWGIIAHVSADQSASVTSHAFRSRCSSSHAFGSFRSAAEFAFSPSRNSRRR